MAGYQIQSIKNERELEIARIAKERRKLCFYNLWLFFEPINN